HAGKVKLGMGPGHDNHHGPLRAAPKAAEVIRGSYDRQAPKQREPGYDRKCRDAVKEDRKIEIDAGRRNPRTVESSPALALRFSYHDSAVRSSVSCQYGSHAVGGIHFPVNNEVPADDPGCELFANCIER